MADDYADIMNQLDNQSDDTIEKEPKEDAIPANDNGNNSDDNRRSLVLNRRLSTQKVLVETLRQTVNSLQDKLKQSEGNNRVLKDQLKDQSEQDDIPTENNKLKQQCSEWKVKYEEEQKGNERLKEEISKLRAENEQLKMKSLDSSKWEEWISDDVYLYLMSMSDGLLQPYKKEIKKFVTDSQVKGTDLPQFSMNDWQDCGITTFADRKKVVDEIKLLEQQKVVEEMKLLGISNVDNFGDDEGNVPLVAVQQ